MRNQNSTSRRHTNSIVKKQGRGGTPIPPANSGTPSGNETLEKSSRGPAVKGVTKPVEKQTVKKESLETSKKNLIGNINTFNMSKSLFDKLFEDVMNGGMDEAGTDLPTGDDLPTGNDEYSDEQALGLEGDEVTITLDRAMAEKFCDALHAVLRGGMEDEDESGDEELDMDGEDFGDEDEMGEDEQEGGNPFGEATDIKELGAEARVRTLQNKSQKVKVSPQYSPRGGGKASIGQIPAQDTGSAFTKKPNLHDKGQHKVSSFNYSDSAFNGGSK